MQADAFQQECGRHFQRTKHWVNRKQLLTARYAYSVYSERRENNPTRENETVLFPRQKDAIHVVSCWCRLASS